ncbi:MAG: hypothetical protein AB1750_02050 [Chloroflexota bacterium]
MKNLLLLALTLLLAACSGREPAPLAPDAPAEDVPNIIGEYALNGVDFYDQEYGGRLSIQAGDAPGQYKLIWIVTGYVQQGVGALTGNQLTVEWKTLQGPLPDLHGTATYTITVNGELYGTRHVEGYEQAEIETAYPNPQ